jgi:uncharacterized protein (TIGR03083 family)
MTAAAATAAGDIPRPSVGQAMSVLQAEVSVCLALLRDLDPADWQRRTDCTGWTVRDVVAHMVGQAEEAARPHVGLRRVRRARRHPGQSVLDTHNQCQVEDRATVSGERLITDLARFSARGIRAVRRIPAPLRRVRLSRLFPEAENLPEDSVDYLVRVLMPRDPWMHRVDIATAAGRTLALDGHDRHVVEQVVRDLAGGWPGPPVLVDLTGPAGGRWSLGTGTPVATLHADAVSYLQLLSGRPARTEPTVEGDPAAGQALLAARVEF